MVKEKVNSIRTYDADGFRRRAACLCTRYDRTELQVLLVTGSGDPSKWVVPGGGIEPTEEAAVAALRELEEEAGARGTITNCIGVFENQDRKTRTSVFAIVVKELLDDWEDAQIMGRQRNWFNIPDALSNLAVHKPVQKTYLLKLLDLLNLKNGKIS